MYGTATLQLADYQKRKEDLIFFFFFFFQARQFLPGAQL